MFLAVTSPPARLSAAMLGEPTTIEQTLDIGRLFDEHAPMLLRLVERLTGVGPHVEDIVQDIFLIAHRRADQLAAVANRRAWLCRVATHLARHHHRKTGRQRRFLGRFAQEEQGRPETARPDLRAEQQEDAKRLRACIAKLTNKQREVFVLYEMEGFEGKQIAELLEIPENTVWTRLRDARLKLRKLWKRRARGKEGAP